MADLYKIINGKRRKLTANQKAAREAEELAAENERATHAKYQAEELYKSLKSKRCVTVDSIEYDLSDSFEFDYQRRGGGSIRVKQKNGKTRIMAKQDTDAIEAALFAYLNSVADAFDADMDAIDSGDYSLTNLKTLES
jgi:hypothetical protein